MLMDSDFEKSLEKLKSKVNIIISQKQMYSVMNDTKWRELQQAINELLFPPPYELKYVTDEEDPLEFNEDVTYIGDWSDEPLTPFFRIEWIKVRPRYRKYRGRLIQEELVDETEEFIYLLKKYYIPYEEKQGTFIIYGYRK